MTIDGQRFLHRLQEATNAHDVDAVVDCFTPRYRNITPAHPSRGFDGTGQVRANWLHIFTFVPDLRSSVLSSAVNGSEVWSEWEMIGTRLDGTPHCMRGVIVFEVQDGRAASARFYLEPVDESVTTADAAVRSQVHADGVT